MGDWQSQISRQMVQTESENLRSLVRPGCRQHFMIFTGAIGMAGGMNPLRFLQRSGLGNRNVTLIRDPYRNNYRQGIGGNINDQDSLFEALATRHRSLEGATELYCIGNSSGAFGALLYGHLLVADLVWAFSPRTARVIGHKQAKEQLYSLLSNWNGKSRYRLIYDPENGIDCNYSQVYANCPGVELIPREGYGGRHNLMMSLANEGSLPDMFPDYERSVRWRSSGRKSGRQSQKSDR